MCMMMADVMEALGLYEVDDAGRKRPLYVIRVNNRKVLDGVLEAIELGGPQNANKRLTVLRALDKKDRLGLDGVIELLGAKGRTDESGDHTAGVGLNDSQIERVLNTLGWSAPGSGSTSGFSSRLTVNNVLERLTEFGVSPAGAKELLEIDDLVRAAGYGEDRIVIDPSVVRGLEYYTGPVYEAELLAEIPNEEGQIVRFGSVGGGGRYDGLVSRFRGEPVPATGFSIGVSRLMTALKNLGKLDTSDIIAPVVVLVLDRDTESLGRYQKMVSELRAAKIRAELYLGGAGMKAQMKYADRRGAPCVVIQGGDERAKGEVQIKDLIEGARLSAEITDNAAWREGRPAQVTVPEGELVAAVQRILAAQAKEKAR
jgi:histidyl-tRNA synthetase